MLTSGEMEPGKMVISCGNRCMWQIQVKVSIHNLGKYVGQRKIIMQIPTVHPGLLEKHPWTSRQNRFKMCVCSMNIAHITAQKWQIRENDKYCAKFLLTHQRLLSLRESMAFFQIVGTEPGFKRLSVPFMCTARMKQSLVKWMEHTPNVPFGLKSFLCWHTNLFQLTRSLPIACVHRNSQLFIAYLVAILNYTSPWRHFVRL